MARIKNWTLIREWPHVQVWVNKAYNKRVVIGKGDTTWQGWVEKNIGPVGQDMAHIPNGFFVTLATKKVAYQQAIKWMKRHPRG